ncbi:MAG: hypothetical protein JO165_08590, partial [Candidatus Eremiobacteraeota bacterium]|nr:hypothetical protein [Candidatus Eremiobacteraeota bacterium]
MRRSVRVGLLAAIVLILLAVLAARHTVTRFALTTVLSLATGYRIDVGDMHLGLNHGAFLDTHVSRHGEPVLDAVRIDLYYNLRDLLPGSSRRFGLVGVTIDHPQLTLIHHQDGTYNVKSLGGGTGGGGAPSGPVVPFNFFARVRGGEAQLIDQYQYYKEARLQRVHNIDADINVNTQTRTHYTVTGAFADIKNQPFRAVGTIDYTRGFAMHRVRAAAIPLKAIGNYIINSPAAHIVAGTAHDLDATIYALGFGPSESFSYHVNALASLNDGQFYIRGLAKPLDAIHGTLQIFDGGLAARKLTASIAGIPVNVAGGIFNFRSPQFRLGVLGSGPLERLRTVLAFSRTQPVRGIVQVHTLIEGPISQPLIFVGISGPRAYYSAIPLDAPNGLIAVYGGNVVIAPLHASYSGIALNVHGRLKMGPSVDSNLSVSYDAPASHVPYLGALVSADRITGTALLSGQGTHITARGYLATENPAVASTFYAIANGTGTVGPFFITPRTGGSAIGAYSLDRPHGESAFWVSAEDLRVRQPTAATFPGLALPELPKLDGRIVDANVIGDGSGSHVAVAGRALAESATIAGVAFSTLGVSFAGTLKSAAINSAHADGPWGRFDGTGSFAPGALIARGSYSGTLEGLRPFTGDIKAHGSISGPMAIAMVNNRVVVQAQNALLHDASVSGVPVSNVSGTIAYEKGKLQIYHARAGAAGGDVVAAGTFASTGSLAVATTTLDGQHLHGLGIPIQRGAVAAIGTLSAGTPLPTFDGGVIVRNGASNGIPLSGTSKIHLAGTGITLSDAVADVNGTIGIANGRVDALTSGAPRYNVHAYVPSGDVVDAAG